MDYAPLIEKRRARLAELEQMMALPDFFVDARRAGEALRERRRIQELLADWEQWEQAQRQLLENRSLLGDEDPVLAELAAAELAELEPRVQALQERV
ncbi:MAG: PCRF domain-containing protein, partial [Akkermansia sp.]